MLERHDRKRHSQTHKGKVYRRTENHRGRPYRQDNKGHHNQRRQTGQYGQYLHEGYVVHGITDIMLSTLLCRVIERHPICRQIFLCFTPKFYFWTRHKRILYFHCKDKICWGHIQCAKGISRDGARLQTQASGHWADT